MRTAAVRYHADAIRPLRRSRSYRVAGSPGNESGTAGTAFFAPVSQRLMVFGEMGFFVVLKAIEYIVRIGLSTLMLGMVLPVMKKYFGLFERIFLYSGNIYFLVFCILIISTQLR